MPNACRHSAENVFAAFDIDGVKAICVIFAEKSMGRRKKQ
jgi:hypothetical protein